MATDNFNRADGGLGTNWTTTTSETAFVISANIAEPTSGSDHGGWWNANAFANDQYSQCLLPVIATAGGGLGTGCGVSVREANGARTYYRVVASAAGTELGKTVTGTFTSLKTDATVWANGDTIRLEVSGTSLTVKRNGSTISALSTTDGSISSGSAGIKYSGIATGAPVVDDWDGGDLAGGGTTLTPAQGAVAFTGQGTKLGFTINMPDEP